MIVEMVYDKINEQAAKILLNAGKSSQVIKYYKKPDLNENIDERLILLELSGNEKFYNSLNAANMVDELQHLGFSSKTKFIDLYISEPSGGEESLLVFGNQLASEFWEKYKREVQVRVISDFNSDRTILKPPSEGEVDWKVYGVTSQSTKLLWRGVDLDAWISQNPRVCIAIGAELSHKNILSM